MYVCPALMDTYATDSCFRASFHCFNPQHHQHEQISLMADGAV